MPLIDRIGRERGRKHAVEDGVRWTACRRPWRLRTTHPGATAPEDEGGRMINLHVIGNPGEEPGAAPPWTRRRLPLRIAEVREVQAPPAPTPLPGHLCEQCLDAPAVLVVPAPGGGDMGICTDCQQAAAIATLPVLTAATGQQTLWHPIRDADRLAAYRAAAGVPLPAWWDRCVATAPARVCPCGSYRLHWGDDDTT